MITTDNIKKDERIVIVGKRYNPQLGTYITGPYVGRIARVNKCTFTVKFDKESDNEWYPKTFDFAGFAKKRTNCIYGSMHYEAYSVPDAICLCERHIEKYDPKCLKVKELKRAIDKLAGL